MSKALPTFYGGSEIGRKSQPQADLLQVIDADN